MKLLSEESSAIECREIGINDVKALSEVRVNILKILATKEMYAAEIARELGIEILAVYYHIKMLEKSGFIKFADYEEKRGGIAKKYQITSDSYALVINDKTWKKIPSKEKTVPKIFSPFIDKGFFDAKFILGSPDPHGKYRARGSEFAILELAMFLGNFATFSFPLYILDTQLKEEDKKQNLVLAGGPKVNTLVADINSSLRIGFDKDSFDIYSKISNKRYNGNIGIIELIDNPFSKTKKKKILLLGGLNQHGTRAAVLSILTKNKKIEEGNKFDNKVFAKAVEGFDEDGDGIIDSVEILE